MNCKNDCGREVAIKKTQECRKCYKARYTVENRERRNADDRAKYQPLITVAGPTTAPCSYDAAHQRVEYWRGLAKSHTCFCGKPAEEWSYRNYSEYEITGTRKKLYPSGTYGPISSKWSTHVKDYDALCVGCHQIRDAKHNM